METFQDKVFGPDDVCPNGIYRKCSFNMTTFSNIEGSAFVDCFGSFTAKTLNNTVFRRSDLEVYCGSWSNVKGTKSRVAFVHSCRGGMAVEYPRPLVSRRASLIHYELAAFGLWSRLGHPAMSFGDKPSAYTKTAVSHLYVKHESPI